MGYNSLHETFTLCFRHGLLHPFRVHIVWGGGPPGVSCVSLHLPQVTELRAFQAHPVWLLSVATHSVRAHRLSYAPLGTRAFQVHLCGCSLSLSATSDKGEQSRQPRF